jgi:hypothetical protein
MRSKTLLHLVSSRTVHGSKLRQWHMLEKATYLHGCKDLESWQPGGLIQEIADDRPQGKDAHLKKKNTQMKA